VIDDRNKQKTNTGRWLLGIAAKPGGDALWQAKQQPAWQHGASTKNQKPTRQYYYIAAVQALKTITIKVFK